jgi:hypothetical protein
MEVFELGEIAKILGMPLTKAKNWTVGRPFKLEPSIKTASGHGSRNLFSLEDVYLMGVANELSKAGMAANAIGKLAEAVKAKFPGGLGDLETLFVTRGPKLAYRIETREDRRPADAVVSIAIDVRGLRDRIDREIARLRRA